MAYIPPRRYLGLNAVSLFAITTATITTTMSTSTTTGVLHLFSFVVTAAEPWSAAATGLTAALEKEAAQELLMTEGV